MKETMMEIIPAIDVMRGKVVRIVKGDPETVKFYDKWGDPVAVARKWESEGAKLIHFIDLDSAFETGNNLNIIEKAVNEVKVPVQVGGGIRSLSKASKILKKGVNRIILGSLALKKPCSVKKLLDEFGNERIVVALDHLNRIVMSHGWRRHTNETIVDALQKFLKIGVKLVLVTSVARDGTMEGPDLETLKRICNYEVKVISAGGIRNLKDLVALEKLGIHGVVIGKALYEEAFSLGEALNILEK